MQNLRDLAIEELSKREISPVDKVVLARKHHVKGWLRPAFEEIIEREEMMTMEQIEQLQMNLADVHAMWGIREIYIRNNSSVRFDSAARDAIYRARFEEIFGDEIKEVDVQADLRRQNVEYTEQVGVKKPGSGRKKKKA